MMRPRPRSTHGEKRSWSYLPLLVPTGASSCDGCYWRFDWEPVYVQRQYEGKKWKLVSQHVKEIPLTTQEESRASQLPPLWRKHYRHFIDLVKLLAGDAKNIEEFIPPSADTDYRKTASRNPWALVSARFEEAVKLAKFVMWQKNGAKKLTPGLLLASEEMVPFALAAYNSIYERGQRFCERKNCGKEFVPTFSSTKREQLFCSSRCRHADQEQRRRDRKRKSGA